MFILTLKIAAVLAFFVAVMAGVRTLRACWNLRREMAMLAAQEKALASARDAMHEKMLREFSYERVGRHMVITRKGEGK